MKYKTQKKSSAIVALLMVAVFFLAQFVLALPLFHQKTNANAFASGSELDMYSENISVTNANFAESSGSKFPKSPTNWTASSNASSADSLKAGVIDISTANFDKNREEYGLSTNPDSPSNSDKFILMLNADKSPANYGYKSASITLDAQSYYTISFSALTNTENNNGFSAYIVNDNLENTALNSFVNMQNGVWNTYTFFIKTGFSSQTVNLELWLGTKSLTQSALGAVFFDNIKASKYTETAYANIEKDTLTDREISFTSNAVDLIANSSFEKGAEGFTRMTAGSDNVVSGFTSLSENGFNYEGTKIAEAPATNMLNARVDGATAKNQKGLFINNLVETKTGYKSSPFTVKRFENLSVSVWVKTGNLSSNGASVMLKEVVEDNEEPNYTSSFTSVNTNSYENKFTNDWAQYTFYVEGNAFEDVTLELQLWVGSDTTDTQGYAFFDEIQTHSITSKDYKNASEGTYVKKLSLSNLTALDIANGAFNLITDDEKVNGVYAPSDWTLSSESGINGKYSGIINTKKSYYDAYKSNYGSAPNPGVIADKTVLDVTQVSNNVLMIYNPTPGDQTFKSSEYSLSTDTSYMITFYAKVATSANFANVQILNNNNVVANFTITNRDWTKYTAFVKCGKTAKTLSFALSLGDSTSAQSGHAFFDDFLSETTEDDIYSKTASQTTKIIDLSEENFLTTGEQVNGVYTPYLWTANSNSHETSSIIAGILDTNNTKLPSDFDLSNADAKTDNRLVIFSPNDTHFSFTSKESYTFNANSYYKVDITYKLFSVSQDSENVVLDDKDKAIPYGAFLELSGLNLKSTALTTSKDNKFQTYSFYIRTSDSEASSAITISLGGSNALTKGGIAISSTVVSESTESAFNEVNEKNLDPALGLKSNLSGSKDTSSNEGTDKPKATPNFQLIDIAGIIIVVAIVIAIIGIIVKQVMKRKKPVKTTVGQYDRTYNVRNDKSNTKLEVRLQEVEAELTKLNATINSLTKAQNELIAQHDKETDTIKQEKLMKQIEKIGNQLSYELDNKESVLKERDTIKSMMNN